MNTHLDFIEEELKLVTLSEVGFIRTSIKHVKSNEEKENIKQNKIIPEKLIKTVEIAFEKGFETVFISGTELSAKRYTVSRINKNIANIKSCTITQNDKIHNIEKKSKKCVIKNKYISAIEGTALGILGIGIPDIPIFITLILSTIHDIAVSFGYGFVTEKEQIYILHIISMAMAEYPLNKVFSTRMDKLLDMPEAEILCQFNRKKMMKIAASKLSEALLMAKVIQGVTIIGAVGGTLNVIALDRISNVAQMKYKKRYLTDLKNLKYK